MPRLVRPKAQTWRWIGLAVWAMALTAVLFYPVFYSRLGLRAISLPLLAGLMAYFWWRGWQSGTPRKAWLSFGLAGLFAGLASYTYMASRALPFLWGFFYLYLLVRHHTAVRQKWRGLLLTPLIYALVSLPLLLTLRTLTETRIGEVDAPLRAFLAGDIWPVLANLAAIGQAWGWQGDLLWRQNAAGLPVFGPLLAVLFYVGVANALWLAWRDERYAFLVVWLGASILPSLMTIDAPSSIRMVTILPLLGLFPTVVVHSTGWLSTVYPQLSTVLWKNPWITLLTFVLLVFHGGRTAVYLFQTWPQNDEVRFVWQADLATMADYLRQQTAPQSTHTTIVGWSPTTMDAPTMALELFPHADRFALRHVGQVGEVDTAVVPAPPSQLLHPSQLPLNFWLEQTLETWATAVDTTDNIVIYRFDQPLPIAPTFPAPPSATFGGELTLLGYDTYLVPPFEALEIVTYWQVLAPPTAERRFFMHMLDRNGEMLGQDDGLSAQATDWQAGDIVVQFHTLPNVNIPFTVNLGVYDPSSPPYPRLLTDHGRDALELDLFVPPPEN
ncbi:MAG: hypothetical protein KDD89_00970 [Anaerolineales bacterium]|nr:hypothetical protein [Anaerolineales bacterium]